MRYERRFAPPLPLRAFLWRLSGHFGVAAAIVLASVAAGMLGYHRGKVFAGLYALYSGLVFVVAVGVVLTPVLHRVLHEFHWEGQDEDA